MSWSDNIHLIPMHYKFIVTLIHIGDNISCIALLLYMYRYTAKVGDGGLVVSVSDFKLKRSRGFKPHITKTCPCNKQRLFSTVKIENFIRKFVIFFLFLLKT